MQSASSASKRKGHDGSGAAMAPIEVKSDINVTPLVDVCLVLLIIFMVVTPMLQKGVDVHAAGDRQAGEDAGEREAARRSRSSSDGTVFVEPELGARGAASTAAAQGAARRRRPTRTW